MGTSTKAKAVNAAEINRPRSPVSGACNVQRTTIIRWFKFTCTLDKLTLKIDRPRLSPADIEKLKEATRNNRAAE
jgi:hypothetical protein